MGALLGEGITELVASLLDSHGEEAVRRALQLVPMLSLLRDSGDFHLNNAARAAGTEGVLGSLVLELPRKPNQPTEVTFIGGRAEFTMKT